MNISIKEDPELEQISADLKEEASDTSSNKTFGFNKTEIERSRITCRGYILIATPNQNLYGVTFPFSSVEIKKHCYVFDGILKDFRLMDDTEIYASTNSFYIKEDVIRFKSPKIKGGTENINDNEKELVISSDGTTYEGGWKGGMKFGTGTYNDLDGGTYEGGWKDDMKFGIGTYTYLNRYKYEGEWKDDMMSGIGTKTYSKGDKYEGEWKDGMMSGIGTKTYSNGAKYEGEWKYGKKFGTGTYIYSNGAKYEGGWKNDEKFGTGTKTYSDGAKYEGEWKYGKKFGTGTYTYSNGDKYEGGWKDDERFGKSIFITKDIVKIILESSSTIFKIEESSLEKNGITIATEEEKKEFFKTFLEQLKTYSPDSVSQALPIMEKNDAFITYVGTKPPEMKSLPKYADAVELYDNFNKYSNDWNIQYLKCIHEYESLGLDIPEVSSGKVLQKQDFTNCQGSWGKLVLIPAYDQVLYYISNPIFQTVVKEGVKYFEIKKDPEISTNDLCIFLDVKNDEISKIEELIKSNKPPIHGTAYYSFTKIKEDVYTLGYGDKLVQDTYKNSAKNTAAKVVGNTVKLFFLNFIDLEKMKTDKELFDLISFHNDCLIFLKLKNGVFMPLMMSEVEKEKGLIEVAEVDKKI
jgi:hypothetical protein